LAEKGTVPERGLSLFIEPSLFLKSIERAGRELEDFIVLVAALLEQ
jgi:hypothetical protein